MKKYLSFLGGIVVCFSIDISGKKKPLKLNCFFLPADIICNYDVEMNFTSMLNNKLQPEGDVLLSQQKSILFQKKEKFQLVCFFDEKKRRINWLINFDRDFSKFQYFFAESLSLWNDSDSFFFNRFLLQHTFINHHGLIIHAAGGAINGKGMVFPAISGTGKSTLSHLLLPHPENQLFSEERIIMRRLDDGWHLWGTPWKGSGVIARNESAPLNAIVFLSQAPETKISKLPTSAALHRLLETVSIPWYSQEWTNKGLAVCESLLRAIPTYELAFRPDQTAVQAVAELAASLD